MPARGTQPARRTAARADPRDGCGEMPRAFAVSHPDPSVVIGLAQELPIPDRRKHSEMAGKTVPMC